jgi:hypothetical protein
MMSISIRVQRFRGKDYNNNDRIRVRKGMIMTVIQKPIRRIKGLPE